MTETGHNSNAQLKSIIGRVERLTEEKQIIADDIKDVYAEAKGAGFDVKALRAIVKRRRQDADALAEHEAIVETYMHSLGMLADTDLGQAAARREFGDTKMTITAGGHTVETTAGAVQRAADFVSTPAGRRKIREVAAEVVAAKLPDTSTADPPFLPGDDEMRPAAE